MATATPQADYDARLSRLEGIVEQMNERLNSIETRLTGIETSLRWIIGIQFTTLIALGSLIMVKLG